MQLREVKIQGQNKARYLQIGSLIVIMSRKEKKKNKKKRDIGLI